MMQVVVLNSKLQVEELQERRKCQGRISKDAKPAVTKQLDEDDILVADPRLVKAHWHTHEPDAEKGQHRDDDNVKELLPAICV